mmetsp:Transcript_104928/g.338357  ORF Transcript_104928/g.338357 Transcript_104928/m.338357 type:complete len:277 (-) Transcript_104928:777-1607(-)
MRWRHCRSLRGRSHCHRHRCVDDCRAADPHRVRADRHLQRPGRARGILHAHLDGLQHQEVHELAALLPREAHDLARGERLRLAPGHGLLLHAEEVAGAPVGNGQGTAAAHELHVRPGDAEAQDGVRQPGVEVLGLVVPAHGRGALRHLEVPELRGEGREVLRREPFRVHADEAPGDAAACGHCLGGRLGPGGGLRLRLERGSLHPGHCQARLQGGPWLQAPGRRRVLRDAEAGEGGLAEAGLVEQEVGRLCGGVDDAVAPGVVDGALVQPLHGVAN